MGDIEIEGNSMEENEEELEDQEGEEEQEEEEEENAEDMEEEFEEEMGDENEDATPSESVPQGPNLDDHNITSEEIESLTKDLVEAKVELAFLRKRKKLLLEEIHRQCLEGELDPKKRLKPFYDKRKKMKVVNENTLIEKA